ncbi:hypothetical protein LZ554_005781 [Drepanopeziza brunnea f. sp. 'monogermtubi']|nr:hypothetical protein LZ554_005781 [Drepanopeziza brunnea f. sp. 'monogermtubi']
MAIMDMPSADTHALKITRNDASTADPDDQAPADFKYENGILSWEKGEIKSEDVVTIIPTLGRAAEYTIFSIEPSPPPSEALSESAGEEKQYPFKLRTTNAMILPGAFLSAFLFSGWPAYMTDAQDVYVLISTLSGTGLAVPFWEEILHPLLRSLGFEDGRYSVVKTRNAESVRELTKVNLMVAANEGRKQTVVMLSGDGGMVDTINALGASERSSKYVKPTVVQLPLGTGNALFHSLHASSPLPSIYTQALQTLLRGTPRPLPIFRASFSPGARLLTNEGQTISPLPKNALLGAVVASHGLHSTLVADSDTVEYRKYGDKRFGMVAKDLMFPPDGSAPHAYKARITLIKKGEEEVMERKEHGYVLAAMVSHLERTFTVSPKSRPFERVLRVVHFGALDGETVGAIMGAAYQGGGHVERPDVGYEAVDGMRVTFEEEGEESTWRRCCVDGSIVAVEEGGWMDVRLLEEGGEVIDIVANA